MFQGDFAWLNFDVTFDQPNEEATRSFVIDDSPVEATPSNANISAEGFLLIQARNAGAQPGADGEVTPHEILINGRALPSFDIVGRDGWNLWMDRIPDGILRRGTNRLTIRRITGGDNGNDRFRVANVVVQWRELPVSGGVVLPDPVVTAEPA